MLTGGLDEVWSGPRAVARWWPYEVRFHCTDRAVLQWFHQHLYTTAEWVVVPPAEGLDVAAVVDAGRCARLRDAVSGGPTERVEGFAGEFWSVGDVEGIPAWCSDDLRGPVVLRPGKDRYLLVTGDVATAATGSVRVARELLRTEVARRGGYTMHGSLAWSPALGGVLYAGSSGSGKTTMAIETARAGGYYVSGDQTDLLRRPGPDDGARLLGVGLPWINRVGFGTLRGMGLASLAREAPLLRPQPAREGGRIAAAADAYISPAKFELTGLEMEALLEAPTAALTSIDLIVLLTGSRRPTEPRISGPGPDRGREHLRVESREPDQSFRNHWLAAVHDAQPAEPDGTSLDRLVEGVRTVRLRWSPEHGSAREVLDVLQGADAPDGIEEGT